MKLTHSWHLMLHNKNKYELTLALFQSLDSQEQPERKIIFYFRRDLSSGPQFISYSLYDIPMALFWASVASSAKWSWQYLADKVTT